MTESRRVTFAFLDSPIELLDRWSVAILRAAVAFVVLIVGAYALHFRGRIRFVDEGDYLAIARNLAHGNGFSIDGRHATAYRAPGWPVVLAPFRLVGIPVTGLRLVMVALLALTVWLAWLLANDLGGRVAAALAAIASAVYPLEVYTTSTFYPETLATTLLMGATLCTVRADRSESGRSARKLLVAAGLLYSWCVLTVPPFAVAAVIGLAWYGFRHRGAVRTTLSWAIVALLVPIAMWTTRDAVSMHAFVPATTGSGYNLLLGNSEHATYGSGVTTDISRYQAVAAARKLDEVALNRYYQSSAVSWIENHPGRALLLWAEKSLNYFNATNKVATAGESSPARNLLAAVTYYPLLALLVARLLLVRRYPLLAAEWLLLGTYVLMAPAMGIFVTRVRYRVPLDEVLLVLIATWIGRMAAGSDGRRAAVAA